MVLAKLNRRESDRVSRSLANPYAGGWRIEMFGIESNDPSEVAEIVKRRFALLSCTQRLAPTYHAVLDRYDADHGQWVRVVPLWGGAGARQASLSDSRLDRWGELVAAWPVETGERIYISLDFFRESIIERQSGSLPKALLTLAVAFEALIGDGLDGEITYRLCQRASLLVTSGDNAVRTMARIKKLYGARSRLVHDGKTPTLETVTHLQQYMMRAIPSLARLSEACGGIKPALTVLDRAPFERDSRLDALVALGEESWWSKVDVVTIPGWL